MFEKIIIRRVNHQILKLIEKLCLKWSKNDFENENSLKTLLVMVKASVLTQRQKFTK